MRRPGWVLLGVVLLVLGGGALLFDGFAYTTDEEVLTVGPIEVTAEREERVNLPPWLAGMLVGAGAIVLVIGFKQPDTAA